ncbi:hypothetical protein D3C73_1582340 [compost metagenome]
MPDRRQTSFIPDEQAEAVRFPHPPIRGEQRLMNEVFERLLLAELQRIVHQGMQL